MKTRLTIITVLAMTLFCASPANAEIKLFGVDVEQSPKLKVLVAAIGNQANNLRKLGQRGEFTHIYVGNIQPLVGDEMRTVVELSVNSDHRVKTVRLIPDTEPGSILYQKWFTHAYMLATDMCGTPTHNVGNIIEIGHKMVGWQYGKSEVYLVTTPNMQKLEINIKKDSE